MQGQVTFEGVGSSARGAVEAGCRLDELARQSEAELARRYQAGTVAGAFFQRSGRPKGRMLTVRGLSTGRPHEALRRLAALGGFPWGGKSFFAGDGERGRGINRVRLGAARFQWFPFDTRLDVSLLDGRPTILLDYEKSENPFFIRRIRDELREIEPGLFLGPAMWKDDHGGAAFVLWFALDFNDPEPT